MAEVANIYYANAAQAVRQPVSGSDPLKATTICILETTDGQLFIGSSYMPDDVDDTPRRQAAYRDAETKMNDAAEVAARLAAPAVIGQQSSVAEVPAESITDAEAAVDTVTGGAGNDAITGAGDDTVAAADVGQGAGVSGDSSGNDTVDAGAGAAGSVDAGSGNDTLTVAADAAATPQAK